jgi:predicted permease
MNLFITTFESVAVLLGIGIIGFWIIRKRIVPGPIVSLLSPLALDIALPCLIFVNILSDFHPAESPDWWLLPLWWCFFTIIAAGLTFLFRYLSHKETRQEFAISLFYQNGIFFPLAILAGMFPNNPSYLVYLFIFTLFFPAFFFSTYPLFFKGKTTAKINIQKIVHPVLIMTLLALAIRLLGLNMFIPGFAINIFALLGGMTIPLLMLILGGNVYNDFHEKGTIHIGEMVKFISVKNVAFPLIFLGILYVIHPAYEIALIILLQSAVPPVTAVPLVTERCGGDRFIVNQFMVASFLVSLVTLPSMVYLFSILM